MVKSAAVNTLESNGVSVEDADGLLNSLAEKAYPNLNSDLEKAAEYAGVAELLTKAASYITELEVKLDSKEAEINEMQKSAQDAGKAPLVDALTGTGAFTKEDLEALNDLDERTLNKVASLTDRTPHSFGGPSNRPGAGMDALTEFLTS